MTVMPLLRDPGCDFVWTCSTCPFREGMVKRAIRYASYAAALAFGISGVVMEIHQLPYPAALAFTAGFVVVAVALIQWFREVLP